MHPFPTKDTTLLLESCDLEAGPQPHSTPLLIFRPRRPLPMSSVDTGFRLRLVVLLAIASISLVSIVVISQQLIVRHLSEQAEAGELVLQLDIQEKDTVVEMIDIKQLDVVAEPHEDLLQSQAHLRLHPDAERLDHSDLLAHQLDFMKNNADNDLVNFESNDYSVLNQLAEMEEGENL